MFTELWRELKNEEKTDPDQLLIDYNETFENEHGKRVLRDIEKNITFRSYKTKYGTNEKIDMNILIWQEAQRNLFNYILDKITAVPKKKERKVNNEQYNRP